MKQKLFGIGLSVAMAGSPAWSQQQADGWAGYQFSVTGGDGGSTAIVTTASAFISAVGAATPQVVMFSNSFDLGASDINVRNNKTIIGLGVSCVLTGDLRIYHATNVIIRNVFFTNPNSAGDGDGITCQYSTRVWIDHCTFTDCGDGSLDITHGSDFVTATWNKFQYTFDSGHNFVNLIGHSDSNAAEDLNKLRVTFHHNWWSTLCVERMPRVRFGKIHSYNNYFNAPGNNYCIRASISSEVFAVQNVFQNVNNPFNYFAPNGKMRSVSNAFINCTGLTNVNDFVFTPPYDYTMDETNVVAGLVTNYAGAGVLPAAVFNAWPTSGPAPLTVTFTNTSFGVVSNFFWSFGDGFTTNTMTNVVTRTFASAGAYTVSLTARGPVGAHTLTRTNSIVVTGGTGFEAWQLQYFGCTNCPQAAADADPDGDGQSNAAEFQSGTNPTNNASALRVISVVPQSDDIVVTWATAGGRTNAVQAATGNAATGYSNDFADISAPIIIAGSGDVTTNYTEAGGATNNPSRFYRVRLVP